VPCSKAGHVIFAGIARKIFSKDDVPLDHPSGLYTMISYIPKRLDEVADEMKAGLVAK